MGKLDGQVAVVTGASSGIGQATARLLAAEGASVVLAARREKQLQEVEELHITPTMPRRRSSEELRAQGME